MSKKLLLADDSVTIQRVIELTFSGEDVHVLAVGDGEEAIARIPVEKPDIVLADIGMPKRSGYEVSAFVKGHPDLAHIPVLLLAGAFEPLDDAKARESKCDGVLVKPFEPQHVVARVRELVRSAKGRPSENAVVTDRSSARLMPFPPFDRPAEQRAFSPDDLADAIEIPIESRMDFQMPEPIIMRGDSLDEYFDKLDEAFSSINPSPSSPGTAPGEADARRSIVPSERRDRRASDRQVHAFDGPVSNVGPTPSEVQEIDLRARLASIASDVDDPTGPGGLPSLDELLSTIPTQSASMSLDSPRLSSIDVVVPAEAPAQARWNGAARPFDLPEAVTTIETAPPTMQTSHYESHITLDAQPAFPADVASGRSLIADAFSALLAVEQGEPGVIPVRLRSNGDAPVVTDAMVDDIARRVTERLALGAADQVNAIVRQVVSDVAERLVREEIARIRNLA